MSDLIDEARVAWMSDREMVTELKKIEHKLGRMAEQEDKHSRHDLRSAYYAVSSARERIEREKGTK